MTEPTWKDPLLREWLDGCSAEKRADFEGYFASPPRNPLDMLLTLHEYPHFHDMAARLRSLIDAELARGREAVEVLRIVDAQRNSLVIDLCPMCRATADEDCAPDCRLAKLIGEKP